MIMDLTALILISIPAMLFGAYLRDVAANMGKDEEKHNKYCLKIAAERALDELKRLQRLICLADQDLVKDLENTLKESGNE
jgi:hypothetical protein